MNPNVARLRRKLAPYDSLDLIRAIAAFQLVPENGHRLWRLEVAAGIAASRPISRSDVQVTPHRCRAILASSELAQLLSGIEDPPPNPFTQTLTLPEGAYVLFPGLDDGILYLLARLLEVFSDGCGVNARLRRLAISTLAISDAIARSAELPKGLEIDTSESREISAPSGASFEKLKRVVSFAEEELRALLEPLGCSLEDIVPLVQDLGTSDFNGEHDSNPAVRRPLVRAGNDYVVATPHALLGGLREAILEILSKDNLRHPFVEQFRRFDFDAVARSLGWLGIGPPREVDYGPVGSQITEASFQFDADKLLHLLLLTDTLEDYSSEDPRKPWETKPVWPLVEDQLKNFDERIASTETWVGEVLHVVGIEGYGRRSYLGLSHTSSRCLTTTIDGDSLETIALLEGGQPLVLWQYARAGERLRSQAKVLAFSALDEFDAYLSSQRSFYFSDESRPNHVAISPEGGRLLREKAQAQRDFHGVWIPWERRFRQVTLAYSESGFPLYFVWEDPSRQVALLLEAFSLLIWIVAPSAAKAGADRLRHVQFCELLAYWIWQFKPGLQRLISTLAAGSANLTIVVSIEDSDDWGEPASKTADGEPLAYSISDDGELIFQINHAARLRFVGPDNAGERAVAQIMIHALNALAASRGAADDVLLSREEIDNLIETYAPLGLKKKLLLLNQNANPQLLVGDLPRYRVVQISERESLLDELGNHLASQEWWRGGVAVSSDTRTTLLRDDVVSFFSSELVRLVASLNPSGLLEALVRYNESIVRESAERRLLTPTELACFGRDEGRLKKIREYISDLNQTALPSRFLIEYVTAQPPAGSRLLNIGVYDRLIALAAEIEHWGALSDAIRYRVSDPTITMLSSKRLGVERAEFEASIHEFSRAHYEEEFEGAATSFHRFWSPSDTAGPSKPSLVASLDPAAKEEFGLSLTELLNFLRATIQVGMNQEGEPKIARLEEFRTKVQLELNWQQTEISQALDQFSSRPRADFLRPPAPHTKEDVYPWRFNRALSYLRRPLLIRAGDAGEEIIWGVRHVHQAGEYLMSLCLEGRLKARTLQMKRVIGGIQQQSAEAFNDRVAELFPQKRFVVKTRVKKIGKLRLTGTPGEVLGDIDVLVADLKRKRLLAIETKDLEMARTPTELANELEATFAEGGKHRSSLDRHLQRIRWLKKNKVETLKWLGLDRGSPSSWKAGGLIVTDAVLMTPYLRRCPLPVLSFRHLQQIVQALQPIPNA